MFVGDLHTSRRREVVQEYIDQSSERVTEVKFPISRQPMGKGLEAISIRYVLE